MLDSFAWKALTQQHLLEHTHPQGHVLPDIIVPWVLFFLSHVLLVRTLPMRKILPLEIALVVLSENIAKGLPTQPLTATAMLVITALEVRLQLPSL